MSFVALADRSEIRRAYKRFRALVTQDCVELTRYLGWQGGGGDATIYWNPSLRYWSSFRNPNQHKRFICLFGLSDPYKWNNLNITCEINPDKNGADGRCAGLFIKDELGNVCVAHSGKIGGGRAGVGKRAFLDALDRERTQEIARNASNPQPVILIGPIGPRVANHVASFVREAYEFKQSVKTGNKTASKRAGSTGTKFTFKPEFSGTRKRYAAGSIEARVEHGDVVNALHDFLEKRAYKPVNDRSRDLLLTSALGKPRMIFEIKTDVTPSHVYGAIGQLLFHGNRERRCPKLVMVLPEFLRSSDSTIIARLGISVIRYSKAKNNYRFEGLGALVA